MAATVAIFDLCTKLYESKVITIMKLEHEEKMEAINSEHEKRMKAMVCLLTSNRHDTFWKV